MVGVHHAVVVPLVGLVLVAVEVDHAEDTIVRGETGERFSHPGVAIPAFDNRTGLDDQDGFGPCER